MLQSIEPVKFWNAKLLTEFRKFIWGGFSQIPLSIMEWGRDAGGLGLISIVHKARSLRFSVVKSYLDRQEIHSPSELSPINSILGYFLDVSVICRYRTHLVTTGQGRCELGGILRDKGNSNSLIRYIFEDVALFTKLENSGKAGMECTASMYYKILVSDFSEEVRRKNRNFLKVESLNKSREWEQKVWKKVFYKGLDTKIQAFNYKLVHEALPTLEKMSKHCIKYPTSWCNFCKDILGVYSVENEEHIFLTCYIARAVWHVINDRLQNNGLEAIEIVKENIIYKPELRTPHYFFVSEVTWALWINRCTNLYQNQSNTQATVLSILRYHLTLNSKIDKKLLAVKAYRDRWLGLNTVATII